MDEQKKLRHKSESESSFFEKVVPMINTVQESIKTSSSTTTINNSSSRMSSDYKVRNVVNQYSSSLNRLLREDNLTEDKVNDVLLGLLRSNNVSLS